MPSPEIVSQIPSEERSSIVVKLIASFCIGAQLKAGASLAEIIDMAETAFPTEQGFWQNVQKGIIRLTQSLQTQALHS